MIHHDEQFGYAIHGQTLGEAWLKTVECVLTHGGDEPDEARERKAIQTLRLKAESQSLPDPLFDSYAMQENIDAMIDLVFHEDVMRDFDVVPNFRVGAKSYKKRLEEGDMLRFVIERLSTIPESKKAVMVFPTYEDYAQVLDSPFNDYLPCIVSVQFRLRPEYDGTRRLNTIFHMRSWNIDQKGAGDLMIMAMLTQRVATALTERLPCSVVPGSIDGFITDVHVYRETHEQAQHMVDQYLQDRITARWNARASNWDTDITSPEHYANFEDGYQKFLAFEERVLASMPSLETAIDLGCGTGQTTTLLQNKADKIYLLDTAEEMLKVAQDVAPHAIPLHASVTDIPLPDASVDLAISRGIVVSHLPSSLVSTFFAELSRILRPNGVALFDYLSNPHSAGFVDQSPKTAFTQATMREHLEKHGFDHIEFDGHPDDRVNRVVAQKM